MKKIFLILTILLFSMITNPVLAKDSSPPNPLKASDPPPPIGDNLPLDDHLYILGIAGVLVGSYLSFKRTKIIQ